MKSSELSSKIPSNSFIDTMMTTIVFYGLGRKLPIIEAESLIDSTCRVVNETPSHAHIGARDGKIQRRPKFSSLKKSISTGFEDYDYIEAVNYFEKGNVRDTILQIGVTNYAPDQRVLIKYKSTSSIYCNKILENMLNYTSPDYGILYNLTAREGPTWFADGIVSSGMPAALARSSSEFRSEYLRGKKFSDGFFRDVFKWNYLSKPHLNRQIDGTPFVEWVQQQQTSKSWFHKTKSRGTVSQLDNGSAVWELTPQEIEVVRPLMLEAGLLMVRS